MGRHRKPTNTGVRLARAGALTIMVTAPLGLVGSAMAAPLSSPDRHSWGDSGDDSHHLKHPHSHDSDGYDSDSTHHSATHHSATHHKATHHRVTYHNSDDRHSSYGHSNNYRHSNLRHSNYGHSNYGHANFRGSNSAEPEQWSVEHSTHAAERRAAESKVRTAEERLGSSSSPRKSAGSVTAARSTSWDMLARCESTNNWSANTGNGYKGGLQFNDSTWRAYGGSRYANSANQASREQQIAVAEKVEQRQGWAAWPSCSRKMGLA